MQNVNMNVNIEEFGMVVSSDPLESLVIMSSGPLEIHVSMPLKYITKLCIVHEIKEVERCDSACLITSGHGKYIVYAVEPVGLLTKIPYHLPIIKRIEPV